MDIKSVSTTFGNSLGESRQGELGPIKSVDKSQIINLIALAGTRYAQTKPTQSLHFPFQTLSLILTKQLQGEYSNPMMGQVHN